jgi:succinate-acetate transporter protein
MERMFRVLAFWTGIFTVMFYVGDMYTTSLLFLIQTAFFLTLSYLKLSERMYMYLFAAYLTVFMVGFTWYSEFIHVPGFGH